MFWHNVYSTNLDFFFRSGFESIKSMTWIRYSLLGGFFGNINKFLFNCTQINLSCHLDICGIDAGPSHGRLQGAPGYPPPATPVKVVESCKKGSPDTLTPPHS